MGEDRLRERKIRRARIGVATFVVTSVLVFVLGEGALAMHPDALRHFADVGFALASGVATVSAWRSSTRSRRHERIALRLLALACGTWTLGACVAAALSGRAEFPSPADAFFLAFLPLLCAAFATYGASSPSARLTLKQIGDALVVLLGAAMLFVIVFDAPIPDQAPIVRLVAMSRAIGSVAALWFCVLAFGHRSWRPAQRRVLRLVLYGAFVLSVVEIHHARALLDAIPRASRPLDGLWVLGFAFFVAASVEHDVSLAEPHAEVRTLPATIDVSVPLVLLTLFVTGFEYAERIDANCLRRIAAIGMLFAVAVLIRSTAAARLEVSLRSELLARERQAAAAQRMESVGLLAGGLAHDFNNLLTSLLANLGLLRAKSPLGAAALANVELMEQTTLRAADLARRLMTLARPQRLDVRSVRPNDVLARVSTMLAASLPARIVLESSPSRSDALATLDPGQLEQALLNLGLNAAHAIEDRGTIRLAVRFESSLARESIVFEVEDDGVGMSEETRVRAVEAFFTTRGERGGSGLGLSAVHAVVGAHGGELAIRSALGQGSTFTLRIPFVPATTPEPAADEPTSLRGGHESILVVDDRAGSLLAMRAALELGGYRVTTLSDPREIGPSLLAAPPDLIVTDYDMPHLDGAEVVALVRREAPGIPVVLVSGTDATVAGSLGADAVVPKPFAIADLLAEVRALLDRPRSLTRSA